MRVLMLGGTGAMGRPLAGILASEGAEVVITSRSRSGTGKKGIGYRQGNARDNGFLKRLLEDFYDVIIDFMVYGEAEFTQRMELLLTSCGQYIFLSSGRVYDGSDFRMTEVSPRLLESCRDADYLKTDEYALSKARQEDRLRESGYANWTIVRPYITYSEQRLQLGVFEKEQWLYRALKGRTIVFAKDIAEKRTTLTCALDVAEALAKIAGNPEAFGEAVQLAAPCDISWKEALDIYLDVLEEKTHRRPKVYWMDESIGLAQRLGNVFQVKYDRLFHRRFNSEKADRICGEPLRYRDAGTGLKACLEEFLDGDREFRDISWKAEAFMDRLTGERTPFKEIPSFKRKAAYFLRRCLPGDAPGMRKLEQGVGLGKEFKERRA